MNIIGVIIVLHLEDNESDVVRILSEHGLDGRSDELAPRPVLQRENSDLWDWDRRKKHCPPKEKQAGRCGIVVPCRTRRENDTVHRLFDDGRPVYVASPLSPLPASSWSVADYGIINRLPER